MLINIISSEATDQAIQEGAEIFMCVITPEQEIIVNSQDPYIWPLLDEFQDVFPEELPPELPPK
jgi:hypothetical protein